MRKCTIEIGKRLAAAVFALGVCGMSAAARAESPETPAAPSVTDAGTNRPVVAKAIRVGGLRSGETMTLTGRGAERVGLPVAPAAQCATPGLGQGS